MSDKILRHGHPSDTAANWKANNPVIGKGEFAIESDTGKFKIGDGINSYNDIDYNSSLVETELERLNYYGDKDIIPSDESYFIVNETGETITGLTDTGKTQTELVIPYEINGKKITTLFSGSDGISGPPVSILDGNNVITKVIIPKSVTTLGYSSFASCASLTSINIPSSVTSIEEFAFSGCTSLTSINIPSSVTSIKADAFSGCTNLKIYCEQGSYVETYAKENNIPIVYTEIQADSIPTKVSELQNDSGYAKEANRVYCMSSEYIDISELPNNDQRIYGEVSSINVAFPDNLSADYISCMIFSTPNVIPENYTTFPSALYFKGDECNGGIFVPNTSTRYTMLFYHDGVKLIGLVSGIEVVV